MRVIRAILPDWAREKRPDLRRVQEGEFSDEKIAELNALGYNIYYLPNTPTFYSNSRFVEGSDIDKFEQVFVDMDVKDGVWTKDTFVSKVKSFAIKPTAIVDSGNGIHVYWAVDHLDAMTYLHIQKRLMRYFKTDEAVCQIFQLLRLPGTNNTKDEHNIKPCVLIEEYEAIYTPEDFDHILPLLTHDDKENCEQHFQMTYSLEKKVEIQDKLPVKFGELLRNNDEVRDIWTSSYDGTSDDRSIGDFRVAHIMFASGFSKDEARSVLINSSKAITRAPKHRVNYADNIIEKIWTYEIEKKEPLSQSVLEILQRKGSQSLTGARFACSRLIDDTAQGFRLGQVIGLVAGVGVGKTTMAMNMFKWFTEANPDFDHFFVSLEQPDHEIAERWVTVCQGDDRLHSKIHILSNYDTDGKFRHLSLDEIREYLLEFKAKTGKQIGTVVIDHIGVLKKQSKNGENQALMDICHQMKGFAVETNTMVIMQSQAPREKAGIGDLELNKDAAFGTVFFESYVDYLITIWQPLKRMYHKGAPTIMSFKFCKIRHKKQHLDNIKEDVCYQLFYDTATEQLRELTQVEETSATFFVQQATNERKKDRKTDIVPYVSRRLDNTEGERKQ